MTDGFRSLVEDFHQAMGLPVDGSLTDRGLQALRLGLLREELEELEEAVHAYQESPDPSRAGALLKELADLQYVVTGYAVTFGLPLEEAFLRVHESHLTKRDPQGRPTVREDGKVLKGPHYRPPHLDDLMEAGR